MDRKNNYYTPILDEQYKQKFGIGTDKEKIHEAHKKAWEIRNFEIDKLWTRVAYFWGFIAAIFAGYIAIMTSENYQKALEMNLDLYLILLGILFSVAWLLVIKGSKQWQLNWEAHIDKLEDEITGPIYKTIYCTKKTFYSVSAINEFLAWVVIAVWIILFAYYIIDKFNTEIVLSIIHKKEDSIQINLLALIAVFSTFIGIFVLLFKCKTNGNGYKTTIREGECGEFIDRNE
jgi:hypothetical protein